MPKRAGAPRALKDPAGEERRARILDAALAEFVERGFAAASTNAISARARVAKGLIFHYFGSKDELYFALLTRALEVLVPEFYATVGAAPADLFERLHFLIAHKIRVAQAHPELIKLLTDAIADAPPELRQKLRARLEPITREGMAWLSDGLDLRPLRDGITKERALEILLLFRDAIERKFMARISALPDRGLSRYKELAAEAWEDLRVLRDGLYKPPAAS
jgi:TetR/AcrR family transcriptional regulator